MKLEQFRWVQGWHLNAMASLFGGHLLGWIDEDTTMLANLCSSKECLAIYVTRSMEKVNFLKPVGQGAKLCFSHKIVHIGKTSMWVYSEVYDYGELVFTAYTCVVSVNMWGKPKLIDDYLLDNVREAIPQDEHWHYIESLKRARVQNE